MTNQIGKKISVCLLTYNHVEVIESTLKSILDQTLSGYEIIVSDDCSNDGTWERILALTAADARIKAVRTPYNIGMANNANFAVKQCDRPYIALLHHDDLYRKDLLEKWSAVLEKNPDISFVFNLYDEPNVADNHEYPFTGENIDGRWFLEKILFAWWGCPVRGTAIIRRSYWESLGGMREQFGMLADVDMWMRLSRTSNVGYINEKLITPRTLRSDDYPDIYTGKRWHWQRHILLYEIHAINRLEYLDLNTVIGRLNWWRFRLKLSLDTTKWLIYAVIRKKPDMITTSGESITLYDLWPLHLLRNVLYLIYSRNHNLFN